MISDNSNPGTASRISRWGQGRESRDGNFLHTGHHGRTVRSDRLSRKSGDGRTSSESPDATEAITRIGARNRLAFFSATDSPDRYSEAS